MSREKLPQRLKGESSFVVCPACGQSVALLLVNSHLDAECKALCQSTDSKHSRAAEIPSSQAHLPSKRARKLRGLDFGVPDKLQSTENVIIRVKQAGCPTSNRQMTYQQAEQLAPVSVQENSLPLSLANSLLQELNQAGPDWVRGTWWMFGKQHAAPRTSAYFNLPDAEVQSSFHALASLHTSHVAF